MRLSYDTVTMTVLIRTVKQAQYETAPTKVNYFLQKFGYEPYDKRRQGRNTIKLLNFYVDALYHTGGFKLVNSAAVQSESR